MRKTFAPPSSLARSLLPILRPRRVVRGESDSVEMKDCLICADSKPSPRKFPAFLSCDHDANICIDCYVQQAVVLIEQHHRWSAVTCPACNVAPPASDLAILLPPQEFTRLDELVKKAAHRDDPAWRWCLAPGCGHGQIHATPVNSQPVKCARCNAKSCFYHQVKWHLGYTCGEYDESHTKSTISRTDEDIVKKITKACPNCAWRIQKEGGCSHMVWLDEDVEDAIMRMEGTEAFTNVFQRRVPQILTPVPAIFNQRFHRGPTSRPVTGGLRLPTNEAPAPPPVTTSRISTFARPTSTRPNPRTRATAARQGAVDLTPASESRSRSESPAPRPIGLRRSPRLHNLAGDPEEQLQELGERMLAVERADMEERRLRRAPQAQPGGEANQSSDEIVEEKAILNDPLGEYERRYLQRRAERAAAPVWPPRFDSLSSDGTDSPFAVQPSFVRSNAESGPDRSVAEGPDIMGQARSHGTESPSFRYGHQRHSAISPRTQQQARLHEIPFFAYGHQRHGAISPRTPESVIGSREQRTRRQDEEIYERDEEIFVRGMSGFDNLSLTRKVELEEAQTSRRSYQDTTAKLRAAALHGTRSSFRLTSILQELAPPDEDLISDKSVPHSPLKVRSPAQRLRGLLPRNMW